MELDESKEKLNYSAVGVLYQKKTKALEKLYKRYKNKFIFSTGLDQFSLFLCDKFIIEDKSILGLWRKYLVCASLASEDEIETLIFSKKSVAGKKYYLVKKNLLKNFKSSPVDLYSSLTAGGRSHFRKIKDKGLYTPNDSFKDSLIDSCDLGKLFRDSAGNLVRFSKNKDFEKFIELSVSLLTFCRENLIVNENPIYSFGIYLGIYKAMILLCEGEKGLSTDFIKNIKSRVTSENQLDTEALFTRFISYKSKLPPGVVLSSLFLSSLFSESELGLINSKLNLDEMVSLRSKDKELVLNHAYIIATRFRNLGLGDENFFKAILQHHGTLTGKGFSDTFRSSISDVNVSFIAAQKIAQFLWS